MSEQRARADEPRFTCRDLIDLLLEYLEGSLGEESLGRFERHLESCAPCRAYLSTYRRTRDLTGRVGRAPMPEELKARLRQLLIEELSADST